MDLLSLLSQRMKLWQSTPVHGLKEGVAPTDVAALRKHLKVLTTDGLIEPCKDTKPSPLEPKETINKQVRFCLDLQHFNQRTLPDVYSDQNIEKGLNCLVGNRLYSTLAVVSGVYQLPTFPGEREKPYSLRPLGFYEYERMQPGYCDNLARFQKIIENLFKDVNLVEVLVHQDYIIIFGESPKEHTVRLGNVYKRLQAAGFMVSTEASSFLRPTVSYAGHEVSDRGIAIDESKKNLLTKWPKPRTVSELQCYVDFCGYYRQFLTGFHDIAKPLNKLLQEAADRRAKNPEAPWWKTESVEESWGPECVFAFCRLRNSLLKTTFLPRANMTQPEAAHTPKKEP